MAKEIIDRVLDVEKLCEKTLEDAKNKAENIVISAKEASKNDYDLLIKKAKDEMTEKISDATSQAKIAVENAEKDAMAEKDRMMTNVKSRQDKAIKEIIDSLV